MNKWKYMNGYVKKDLAGQGFLFIGVLLESNTKRMKELRKYCKYYTPDGVIPKKTRSMVGVQV